MSCFRTEREKQWPTIDDMIKEAHIKRIAELEQSLQLLHDIMKMGGFDCHELDSAAALLGVGDE